VKVAICEYGAGNVRSVRRAFARLGASETADVANADLAVLPGVGSARAAMAGLRERGHDEALVARFARGRPILGICLGEAILKAAGDKAGIVRYGTFTVPMDEVLVTASLDLSGRPFFAEDLDLGGRLIGTFDAELVREFFQAVAFNARMNLHFLQHRGGNAHHVAEAAFKAFGRALDAATRRDERVQGVPSTKGVL